jgi:Skp family chaperone for outer membrane proteins
MKIRNVHLAASAAVALVMTFAGAASAQQRPAAQATPAAPVARTLPSQPALPGVCAFSHDGAIVGSKLGAYIQQRLKTIGDQTDAELQSTGTSLQADVTTLEGQRASLPQTQLEQKALEIRQRNEAFQRLQQVRQREMQITVGKAMQRFDTEVGPLVEMAIGERTCSIVFDADAVVWVSPTMDITPAVVSKLDAKLTEFAIDRERLDQQLAAGQGAQPAAPARPAATQPARPATRR